MAKKWTIAIDAMGGDNAPFSVIAGLDIVYDYLVENDIPFKDTFYGIQSAFYNYIKNLQDFKTRLESLQSDKISFSTLSIA